MEIQIIQHNQGLTPLQKEVISKMPFSLQKYVKAKDSPMISGLEIKEALKLLIDLITNTQVNIGHVKRADDSEANLQIAENLLNLIKSKYQSLTVSELKLAVLNGSISEYGDYSTLSLKTFSDWIKGYLNDINKKTAMSEWNKMIDMVQIRNYSEEQKEQIIMDGCIHAFNDYKSNGLLNKIIFPVDYLCGIYYDYLKNKGLINFTSERKGQIYDEALKIYKSGIDELRKNGGVTKDIYGSIITTISNKKTSQENRSFVNLGKRIGLRMYFDDLLELNEDLKQLLTTK